MLGEHFYFHALRNLVVAFGDLFNNIHVKKIDADNNEHEDYVVPITVARKQRFLARMRKEISKVTTSPGIRLALPIISYDMVSVDYDAERAISPTGYQRGPSTTTSKSLKQFNPRPYNVGFELTIYTMNMDEMLQILEQILATFKPDFNLSIMDVPDLNIQRDVPIKIESVSPEDTYEGTLDEDYRLIQYTISFMAQSYIYPPVQDINVIKTSIANIHEKDGLQLQKYTYEVNPITADENDPHTIDVTIEEY